MDKILVFIPAYNCEKQIIRVLSQFNEQVLSYVSDIIIIDNGSPDNTVAEAKKYLIDHPELPCKILINDKNVNLGGSHKVAFKYALDNGYDYVNVLHGDDQADIRDFIPLYESGEYRSYDCVLGSRFVKGSKLIGYSAKRIFGNKVFNLIFSISTGKKIRDMGSGLNLYNVEMLKSRYFINLSDALYFNAEMLLFSAYYKHNCLFYPISWREDDQVSNAKLFKLSWELFKMAVSYLFSRRKYIGKFSKEDIYSASVVFDNKAPRGDES